MTQVDRDELAEVRRLLQAEVAKREELERELTRVRVEERDRGARIARSQPNYPDTHTGMRQGWVREQIALRILDGAVS